MGQYTRCKSVSNNGRTCHNPEIKYGSTIGGKPGGNNGGNDWCKQLFPTTSISTSTFAFKVTDLIGSYLSFLCIDFPIDGFVFRHFNSVCSSLDLKCLKTMPSIGKPTHKKDK